MKKVILLVLAALVLTSLVLAANVTKVVSNSNGVRTADKTIVTANGEINMHRVITRECDTANVCSIQKEITIERTKDNETRITSRSINVTINREIEIDENNKTYLKINATGRKEIKIMPDTANERAIEVLRSKNFSIELKDTGKYHAQVEKKAKLFGLFSVKMKKQAEIDADTGETKVKKPWWAFLAREQD